MSISLLTTTNLGGTSMAPTQAGTTPKYKSRPADSTRPATSKNIWTNTRLVMSIMPTTMPKAPRFMTNILRLGMDAGGRTLTDIGHDYDLVEGTTDGLDTLSDNMGIDVPDGVVDIVPYAATIMMGARLIYSVVKTEKEFKAADRTTKNQIQVVQTLTLMSRMGITTVLAAAGGAGGGAGGSAIMPGIGTLAGGIGGIIVGAGMGMYLNKHLQPPHAEPCAKHHWAHSRRSVLLQKQAAHQRSSIHIPDKGQRVGSGARLLASG